MKAYNLALGRFSVSRLPPVCVTLYECPWHPYKESLPTLIIVNTDTKERKRKQLRSQLGGGHLATASESKVVDGKHIEVYKWKLYLKAHLNPSFFNESLHNVLSIL